MKSLNVSKLYICGFIIISLLFLLSVVRIIGSRFLFKYSINIFMKLIHITSYINWVLSLILIIIIIAIMLLNYKYRFGKSSLVLSTVTTALVLLIQGIKVGFGIYSSYVMDNVKNNIINNSIPGIMDLLVIIQFATILLLYIAIIIIMIVNFDRTKKHKV